LSLKRHHRDKYNMKSFYDMLALLEADALSNISAPGAMPPGAPPMGAGAPPPMGGMGGGMGAMPPLGGGGMPPMGGGMAPPMGGGMGGPPTPPVQIKPITVWTVVEKILTGKGEELDKKQSGQPQNNMLASAQPPQTNSQPPAPPMDPSMGAAPQGMPPAPPAMPGMPTM
jgi:hypothetical protein